MKVWLVLALILGVIAYLTLSPRLESNDEGTQAAAGALEPVGAAAIDVESLGDMRVSGDPAQEYSGLSTTNDSSLGQWASLNGDAIEALEAGQLVRAIELFEECLAAVPSQEVFAKNLAEALARWARQTLESDPAALADALAAVERALELDPSRDDLRQLHARWKASLEAEGEFWTDETAHFELSYDGQRTELLKHGYTEITALLEEVYGEYRDLLNHEPVGHGDQKIRVLLYERQQFTRITGIGHWAGGAFDGTIRIPVADYARERKSFERVLRHELVHAFVQSYGGKKVPAWINEGLAQWLEDSARASRVQAARAKLKGQTLFALEDLRPAFSGMQDETRIALAYAQSLAFLDYLVTWYGDQLVFELIRGCHAGHSCEETFRARTAQELTAIAGDFANDL